MAGPVSAVGQSLFSSSLTPSHGAGELFIDNNNNKYRYVQAGLAPLVAGNMVQAPAQVATHSGLVVAAAAIGATRITLTTGAGAVTANQYASGWAVIDTGTGLGTKYRIAGHPAAGTTAPLVVTLADPVLVALTGTSRVTLVPNPYMGVIQSPTAQTGAALGAAIFPLGISEYGWIQSGGVAAVLVDGTPAVGAAVVVPGTTAGAVAVDGAAAATQVVGAMVATGAAGKVLPVLLQLD